MAKKICEKCGYVYHTFSRGSAKVKSCPRCTRLIPLKGAEFNEFMEDILDYLKNLE